MKCAGLADGNFIIPQVGIIRITEHFQWPVLLRCMRRTGKELIMGHFDGARLPREQCNTLLNRWGFYGEEMAEGNLMMGI